MPKTTATILSEIATNINDNTTRDISPADARTRFNDIVDVEAFLLENTWKKSVRVRGSTNINVSSAPASVDGVSLSAGDRVLLTGQSTGSQNGLWEFVATSSALVRVYDAPTGSQISSVTVAINEGTSAGTIYHQTAEGVVDTVAQVWVDTQTATDTLSRPKIAEAAATALNGTGSTISGSANASNTSNLIDGNTGTEATLNNTAGQQSFITVTLGTPIASGTLSAVELSSTKLTTSNPPGDLYVDLCDASGNCINTYYFGDRITTSSATVVISVGRVQIAIAAIKIRQSIPNGTHGGLTMGELKLRATPEAGQGTITVLQVFDPVTGTLTGDYYWNDLPWTPPGGTTYRVPDEILTGSNAAAAAPQFTTVTNATARKAQTGLSNGHVTYESTTGLLYKLINAAAISSDASWLRIGPRGQALINGEYVASATVPAAQVGDFLRVGTRGVVSGGVTWYEGEWYQANQDTAGSVDGSTRTHWTQVKDDIELRDKGNYNPTTNSPALTDATGREQERYIVVAPTAQQTRDFGSGNITFPVDVTGELLHKAGVWVYRQFGKVNISTTQTVYSVAHGLTSGARGKQIAWDADGKPKVVTTALAPGVQQIAAFNSVVDTDHIIIDTPFKVVSLPNALLPANKLSHLGNDNDRLYSWDTASETYTHAEDGEAEVLYYIGDSETASESVCLVLDQLRDSSGVEVGGGTGDITNASNIGTQGVGPFHAKSGTVLQFRNVAAATTRVSVTFDGVTNCIDVDVNEGNLSLPNIGGVLSISKGGTGATTQTTAFNNLSPNTTQGDIIYHNGTNNVRLPKGAANQILEMNIGATAPQWADRIQSYTLTAVSNGQSSFTLTPAARVPAAVWAQLDGGPGMANGGNFSVNGPGTTLTLHATIAASIATGDKLQVLYY